MPKVSLERKLKRILGRNVIPDPSDPLSVLRWRILCIPSFERRKIAREPSKLLKSYCLIFNQPTAMLELPFDFALTFVFYLLNLTLAGPFMLIKPDLDNGLKEVTKKIFKRGVF